MMRRSECITAVMVLPAASTGEASAVESATTDSASLEANARGPRRINLNIKVSPDVKLFKGGLLIEHPVRSLGELTSCNAFNLFETCRQCRARQSGFAASPSGARTGSTRIG